MDIVYLSQKVVYFEFYSITFPASIKGKFYVDSRKQKASHRNHKPILMIYHCLLRYFYCQLLFLNVDKDMLISAKIVSCVQYKVYLTVFQTLTWKDIYRTHVSVNGRCEHYSAAKELFISAKLANKPK